MINEIVIKIRNISYGLARLTETKESLKMLFAKNAEVKARIINDNGIACCEIFIDEKMQKIIFNYVMELEKKRIHELKLQTKKLTDVVDEEEEKKEEKN